MKILLLFLSLFNLIVFQQTTTPASDGPPMSVSSLSGPARVVSVGALADKLEFKQHVVINRVEYSDRSIRQRKLGRRRGEGKLRSRWAGAVGARAVQGPVNTNR